LLQSDEPELITSIPLESVPPVLVVLEFIIKLIPPTVVLSELKFSLFADWFPKIEFADAATLL
jgi:hypothetical protein